MGRRSVASMRTLERSIVSRLVCRFRSRAVVELENLALRHQLHVLRRQRPDRPRLFAIDRLLSVLLYRLWPRCLEAMVLVKPATDAGSEGSSPFRKSAGCIISRSRSNSGSDGVFG